MKRSKSIKLVLMGSMTFFMSACDDTNIGQYEFKSTAQCLEFYDADQCSKIVTSSIPRFASKESCEKMMQDQCVTETKQNSGSPVYYPLFLNSGGSPPATSPWMSMSQTDRSNFIRSNSNGFIVNKQNTPQPKIGTTPTTKPVARSGFGSTSRSLSVAS